MELSQNVKFRKSLWGKLNKLSVLQDRNGSLLDTPSKSYRRRKYPNQNRGRFDMWSEENVGGESLFVFLLVILRPSSYLVVH